MNIESGVDESHCKEDLLLVQPSRCSRFTEWAITLEILTTPKLIILPVVLLHNVGGPKFIFFFWPLWGLFSFSSLAVYFASWPQALPIIHSENIISKYLKNIKVSGINSIRILIFWSFFDIILSSLSLIITGLVLFGVFTEADGSVNDSWKSTYILGVIECMFCAVSIICRLWIMVGYTCCGNARSVGVAGEDVYRTLCLCMSVLGSLLAVIFLSMCLHNFLKSEYYYTSDGSDYGCDPMVSKACLLPYPSSHYLEQDSSTHTGYRVSIQDKSLPFLKRGVRMSADYSANRYDGFSVSSMILWHVSGGMQEEQFVSYDAVEHSLWWNSTTLLVNMDMSILHPHFTELDYVDPSTDKVAYIMPARSLEYDSDYVAIVQGLTDRVGAALQGSQLTRTYVDTYLSDGAAADDLAQSDSRFARFRSTVFPKLVSLGVNLSSIQLLWDFHTASMVSTLSPLSAVGNKTMALLQAKAAKNKISSLYTLQFEEKDECGGGGEAGNRGGAMASTRFYRLSVPWYLVNNEVGTRQGAT